MIGLKLTMTGCVLLTGQKNSKVRRELDTKTNRQTDRKKEILTYMETDRQIVTEQEREREREKE